MDRVMPRERDARYSAVRTKRRLVFLVHFVDFFLFSLLKGGGGGCTALMWCFTLIYLS